MSSPNDSCARCRLALDAASVPLPGESFWCTCSCCLRQVNGDAGGWYTLSGPRPRSGSLRGMVTPFLCDDCAPPRRVASAIETEAEPQAGAS